MEFNFFVVVDCKIFFNVDMYSAYEKNNIWQCSISVQTYLKVLVFKDL